MRISPSTILWLAAASSVRMVKGEDSITFDNNDFVGHSGAAVFTPFENGQSRSFHWNAAQKVAISIKEANLRVDDGTLVGTVSSNASSSNIGGGSVATTTSMTTTAAGVSIPAQSLPVENIGGHGIVPIIPVLGSEYRAGGDKRSQDVGGPSSGGSAAVPLSGIITMTEETDGQGGIVTITDLTRLAGSQFVGRGLWFELVWDAGKDQHTVFSRAFAVTADSGTATTLVQNQTYFDPNPVQSESVTPISGSPISSIPPAATSTSAESAPLATVGSSGGQSSHPSSSSGLSTGAVAGIAVAAALIGLALLAALIFCLVRRRRGRNGHALAGAHQKTDNLSAGGYHHHHRATPELIAQKEANAGVVGVEQVSPHSPYSDDGAMSGLPRVSMQQHQGGSAASRQEEMPLAGGYADNNRPASSAREGVMAGDGESLGGSQTGGRATPTAVRHLVEEGMTEDEIRRLEEEERELDQAIEQAGGGRR